MEKMQCTEVENVSPALQELWVPTNYMMLEFLYHLEIELIPCTKQLAYGKYTLYIQNPWVSFFELHSFLILSFLFIMEGLKHWCLPFFLCPPSIPHFNYSTFKLHHLSCWYSWWAPRSFHFHSFVCASSWFHLSCLQCFYLLSAVLTLFPPSAWQWPAVSHWLIQKYESVALLLSKKVNLKGVMDAWDSSVIHCRPALCLRV